MNPPRLLYEDRWLLAVDKPPALLVHRTTLDAQADDDLLTRLRATFGSGLRPAHRLDKGTSGVLLLAHDAETARRLGDDFAAGRPNKRYLAVVRGWPTKRGRIDTPLARDPEQASTGQPHLRALTHWQRLRTFTLPMATPDGRFPATRVALLAVQPCTGRRHQIRRHLKSIGHPLIGDATHGKGPLNRAIAAQLGHARLWLHAVRLRLTHPMTGEPLTLEAEPGPEWACWQTWDGGCADLPAQAARIAADLGPDTPPIG